MTTTTVSPEAGTVNNEVGAGVGLIGVTEEDKKDAIVILKNPQRAGKADKCNDISQNDFLHRTEVQLGRVKRTHEAWRDTMI